MLARTCLLIGFALLLTGAAGQQRDREPTAREILAAHLSHGIGKSPFDSDLWHDEANASIIVRARNGVLLQGLDTLAGGRSATMSRLPSLVREQFLFFDRRLIRTTFPILIGRDRTNYMKAVSQAAALIDAESRQAWRELLDKVAARGWRDSSYHLVWSQAMDSGFSWVPMMEARQVPPLSTMMVWVVHPAHAFQSGTNYYPQAELRDQMVAVTWRAGAADTIGRISVEWETVWSAAVTGTVTPEQRSRLTALGLMDEAGRLGVPVIRKTDDLYGELEKAGSGHVRLVAKHLPLKKLRGITRVNDKATFAMAYHDISWELMARFANSGMFDVPPALRPGAPADVSMAGVCGVVDAHPGLVAEMKKALRVM